MSIKIVRNSRPNLAKSAEIPKKLETVDDLRIDRLSLLEKPKPSSPQSTRIRVENVVEFIPSNFNTEISSGNATDSALNGNSSPEMQEMALWLHNVENHHDQDMSLKITEKCLQSSHLIGPLCGKILAEAMRPGHAASSISAVRAQALRTVARLAVNFGGLAEPHLVPLFPLVLDSLADKSRQVAEQAALAVRALIRDALHPEMCSRLLGPLLAATDSVEKAVKRRAALESLASLCLMNKKWTRLHLPQMIPAVAQCMTDISPEVSKCAQFTAMPALCGSINNRDLTKVLPLLVEATADYQKVPECVKMLYGVVFVKELDTAALALITPVLCRVMNDRSSSVLYRQAAVIVGNMCKLIVSAQDVLDFLPLLVPGLERIIDMGADPELREVAQESLNTVRELLAGARETKTATRQSAHTDAVQSLCCQLLPKDELDPVVFEYLSEIIYELSVNHHFDLDDWMNLAKYVPDELASSIKFDQLRQMCFETVKTGQEDLHANDHETICNVTFNLGYGGMILLKDAALELKRGSIYGIVGKNGCGKSTLMKAIANDQLEGFPHSSQVRTVYVSHTYQGLDFDQSVSAFVRNEFPDIPQSDLDQILNEFGFDTHLAAQKIAALSGGWKMKLELAMAVLKKADILLLDEPTNHLDAANCNWLEKYLNGNSKLTVMVVSHDAGFLDAVCTHIIHYHDLKLRTYKSDFSKFKELVPEAKEYLEYQTPDFAFNFPNPGNLDAVKSPNRTILRLMNVGFTYPGADKPSLFEINLRVSLTSRIAIIGPNGAGKSTMIKILTGETYSTSGKVQKHASLRIAYVAQHAFHHLEQHLEKSPAEYIRWRYESGIDKELLAKETRSMSKLEMDKRDELNIECICGRQKLKRSHQYEIKLVGHGFDETKWMTREELEAIGFKAMVQAYDDLEAARGGSHGREVTLKGIEEHLEQFGILPEIGTHGEIKGLSGGQKVKVVLAAAMWLRPHIIVMDEPTNYLDIQSLLALSNAIKKFNGGVVIISHNSNFVDGCCTQFYEMRSGHLTKKAIGSEDLLAANGSEQPGAEDDSHLVDAQELDPVKRSSEENADPVNGDAAVAKPATKVTRQKKETRRQRLQKEKIKAAKLLKYGPKADGTEYSSEEEVEVNINVGSIN